MSGGGFYWQAHWRASQKVARFFFMDARIALLLLFTLLHIRIWTLILTVIVMAMFVFFENRGYTFESSLRALRKWFLGRKRPATTRVLRRHWRDLG